MATITHYPNYLTDQSNNEIKGVTVFNDLGNSEVENGKVLYKGIIEVNQNGNTVVSINAWYCDIKNDGTSRTNGWTVKVSKSDVKIDSSWCVNIAEQGNYYVITPMSWNSTLESGQSVEFGIQGSGSIGTSVGVTVE